MRSPSTWAGWATSEVMTTSHACHRSMRLPPRRLRVTTLAATPSQPNMPFGARLTTSSLPSSMVASGISARPPTRVPVLPTTTMRVLRRSGGPPSIVIDTRARLPRKARRPEMMYANGPTRPLSASGVLCMIVASNPVPAMTRKTRSSAASVA